MTESAIKSNQRQAQQLFERGLSAAKSGQRRVAAGLLGRAVQFDPQHEQAWLWLSGVVEDPKQIAFCLRSVLSINPHNERARQGLAWLEQRELVQPQLAPRGISGIEPHADDEPEPRRAFWRVSWRRDRRDVRTARDARVNDEHERSRASWWVGWRRNHREMSRAWQLVLSGMILFLVLTLLLNQALRSAVEENEAQSRAAMLALTPTAASLASHPTVVPILSADLQADDDARVVAYLSAIRQPRAQLQAAVKAYREATQKFGDSAVTHAAAARNFHDQMDTAYTTLVEVVPPPSLDPAHKAYLAGLDEERQAMDDMLKFYGSFSIQFANSATLRMVDAGRQFDRARAGFTLRESQANAAAYPLAQTAR